MTKTGERLIKSAKQAAAMAYNGSSQAKLGEPLAIEEIATALFQLLDDIDTADDLAKDNDKLYRNLVRRAHTKRFRYASTDGYSLEFNTKDKS